LNESRNPGLSQTEIEERLSAALGAREILWLPYGLEDDETDGHIDNVAAFVGPGRVVLNWTDAEDDANAERMAANLAALKTWHPSEGTSLEIITLPQPMREFGPDGRRMALSYVNFYICNGGVIMPSFGDPADGQALRILEECFAGRTVVQLPAEDIVIGGGGIHCITHEQPAGSAVPAEGA
jgi:agmatine deiminase